MSPPPGSGRATLVLVPTELEARGLAQAGGLGSARVLQALCGFGPLAAAARTAGLLARLAPARVLLLGVAGSYDTELLPLGSARAFAGVAQQGLDARRLGFSHLHAGRESASEDEDVLPLVRPANLLGTGAGLLLSVCAPAADDAQRRARHERFARAQAEDMEGFAVALAAHQAGVPLAIVRGISNAVGERERSRWDLAGALAAARELALELLETRSPWEPAS